MAQYFFGGRLGIFLRGESFYPSNTLDRTLLSSPEVGIFVTTLLFNVNLKEAGGEGACGDLVSNVVGVRGGRGGGNVENFFSGL